MQPLNQAASTDGFGTVDAPMPEPEYHPQEMEELPRGGTRERNAEILKVSTRSRPSAVAGAIAGVMRERSSVDVQSIGAGATNQAVKAVAIARVYLREDAIDICFVPSFIDIVIDGQERTGVRLLVQRRGE